MNANSLLTSALGYALRGWQVVPLHSIDDGSCTCHREACASPGKHPRINKWPQRATTNREQLTEWWDKWPGANVGVVTGPTSGLVVLDVDPRHHGDLSLAELEGAHGALDGALRCETGGGGWHVYLAHPDFHVRNSAGSLGPGLDIRGHGGFVVAPPSMHASGKPYAWQGDPAEQAGTIPDWMAEALTTKRDQAAQEAQEGRKAWQESWGQASTGQGYGSTALARECEAVRGASEGTRNNALNRSAFSIGQLVGGGEIEHTEARLALVAAAIAAGLGRQEAEAACDSGLSAGQKTPRRRPIQAPRTTATVAKMQLDDDDWTSPDLTTWQLLDRAPPTNDGPRAPKRSGRNVRIVLDNDPRFKDRFWGDRVRGMKYWSQEEIRDEHHTRVQNALDQLYQLTVATSVIAEQVALMCWDNNRDPLVEWLHSLRWDGEHRSEHLLARGFGAAPSKLFGFYSLCWMIGCVARAYRPGCKLDTCLILIGSQGIGKSSGLRALVGDDWFSDTEINFTGYSNKDALMAIGKPWVHEFAELSTLRAAKGERVKAVLSSQVDEFRPSHGREVVRRPRRCCFVGTSNEPEVLSDGTGSRRFWPARVKRVDLEWLRANRDQLWAEAAHYYREGAPWWLPDPVEAARRTEATSYFETDAWQDAIGSFVVGQSSISTADLLDGALKLDRSQQHAGTTRRVAAIMRGMGWQKKAKRDPITGQRRQTWTAPQKKEIQKRG